MMAKASGYARSVFLRAASVGGQIQEIKSPQLLPRTS
jgi:hypothetical protein